MVTAACSSLPTVPFKFPYYLRRLVTDYNNICCRENCKKDKNIIRVDRLKFRNGFDIANV